MSNIWKTIRVSEYVWEIIVSHGKFGETADDVLLRLLPPPLEAEEPQPSEE